MVQRTRSTQYDPKYPWLTDYPFVGAEDPPDPDPNKPNPDPDPNKPDPNPNKPANVDPAELATELERTRQRMIAADQRATAAEKKLQAAEDKDKSELEIANREREEAKAAKEKAEAALNEQRIENAFLIDNTHTWHNNAAALKLLDRTDVTIGEDGKVSGLPAALTKLAREHPYLLKGNEGGGGGGGDGKPTGDGKDGKKGKDAKAEAAALAEKYPILRGRTS